MQRFLLFTLSLFITQAALARPLVVAHRGSSAYLPEHTLEAKALAYGMGADYLEQDVVLAKYGVPVILHDIYLDTVTDVAKKFPDRKRKDGRFYVIDFTVKEIKTMSVTERFKIGEGIPVYEGRFPLWHSKFEVPTLEEEIELIQGLNKSMKRNVGLYVEIKKPEFHRDEGHDISSIVIKRLGHYGYPKRHKNIFLQCFHAPELKRIKNELKSNLPLIQLIADNSWGESTTDYDKLITKDGLQAISKYAAGIGPWLGHIYKGLDKKGAPKSTQLVQWAHEAGLKVHPFTLRADQLPPGIDLRQAMDFLFKQQKVDGVFTDFPDIALRYLEGGNEM